MLFLFFFFFCCFLKTPEFYYQREFLVNANGFDLGVKQDGSVLGDVVLPPWANGSPDTFVRTMRAALEHPIVSANLHRWIDLIFGLFYSR